MAQSGWYDDPDGTPGRLRYFDGTQWTNDTMPSPSATAPGDTARAAGAGVPGASGAAGGSAGSGGTTSSPTSPPTSSPSAGAAGAHPGGAQTPTAPYSTAPYAPGSTGPTAGSPAGGYGQTPYSPQSGPAGYPPAGAGTPPYGIPSQPSSPYGGRVTTAPRRKKGNMWLGVAGGLAVAYFLANMFNGATSGPRTTTTTSTATRPAATRTTALPTSFPTVTNPPVNAPTFAPVSPGASGTLPAMPDCADPTGHALTDGTITVQAPASWQIMTALGASPFQCSQAAGRAVIAGWQMSAVTGSAPKDGKTAQQFAEQVWAWNAENNYGDTPGKASITKQEAVTVGGLKGYQLTGEVRVSGVAGVEGDSVQVLSLQRADGSHSTLITGYTIGDATGKAEMDALWKSLTVKA